MNVVALDDDGALDRLADEWGALFDAAPAATPFQSWEWARAWWSHRRRGRLCILCARDDDGTLVASCRSSPRRTARRGASPS